MNHAYTSWNFEIAVCWLLAFMQQIIANHKICMCVRVYKHADELGYFTFCFFFAFWFLTFQSAEKFLRMENPHKWIHWNVLHDFVAHFHFVWSNARTQLMSVRITFMAMQISFKLVRKWVKFTQELELRFLNYAQAQSHSFGMGSCQIFEAWGISSRANVMKYSNDTDISIRCYCIGVGCVVRYAMYDVRCKTQDLALRPASLHRTNIFRIQF